MPVSKNMKNKVLSLTTVLMFLPLVICSQWSKAAGIQVGDVNSVQVRDKVNLTAQLNFQLSDEALNALDHGVALDIIIDMQALEQRRWLWDRTVADHSERFRLERQALTNHYLVTHKYQRQSFLSLAEALQFIGTIRDYPLINTAELEADKRYHGRIRAWLDIESLPAPMRPTAYISSHWRIDSGWHEWPIQS